MFDKEQTMPSHCTSIILPYYAQQRANENLNRLIRQYFPKKTDFAGITGLDVKMGQDVLNTRPPKKHWNLKPH